MSKLHKRLAINDSSSEDEFRTSRRHSEKNKSKRKDSHGNDRDRVEIPKKRVARPSKRPMPTFEEGDASEDVSSSHGQPHKRRKSIFHSDLVDSEAGAPRGKVQLTFEESLKKAAAKKKAENISKPQKTLVDFFRAPKTSKQGPKKKEIAVDDFFASTSSMKTPPSRKEPIPLVPETPELRQGDVKAGKDDDICLSASSLTKPLMPNLRESLDSPKKSIHESRKEKKHVHSKAETEGDRNLHTKKTPEKSPKWKSHRSSAEIDDSFRISGTPTKSPEKSHKVKSHRSSSEMDDSFKISGTSTKTPEKSHKTKSHRSSEMDDSFKISGTPTKTPEKSHKSKFHRSPAELDDSFVISGTPKKTTPKKDKPSTPKQTRPQGETSGKTTPKPTPSGGRASFWRFQNRDGPSALGSRPIPQGTSTCFVGKTFVITGVLECIERDDAQALIERGGGRVTKAVSKKTSYLIVGRDAGESKITKANALGTPQIDEDAFFDLVNKGFGEVKLTPDEGIALSPSSTIPKKKKPPLSDKPVVLTPGKAETFNPEELWVEKYRPKSRRQLIGQNGAASPANRLFAWLSTWQEDYAAGRKAKAYSSAPPWAAGSSSDNGAWARAALLSGPPGVGKTSAAMAVVAEVGLAPIEMNASDTRSKRSLQTVVAEALGMHSLANCLTPGKAVGGLTSHVLIMDEVDGMAGNEDRGGMQELIGIIKSSKVPVICLCNDRQSAKVRSLANYCLDLRFHRPRVEQIKSAVLSITCREGVSLGASALNEIIAASNQDLRQVINSVQLWCMTSTSQDAVVKESDITASAAAAHKDLRLSPFEVIRKVFATTTADGKPMTFNDCLDLFFQDYSMGPLFVQENYLNVRPLMANGDPKATLKLLAEASNDIATGDIVGRMLQSANAWSLLPTQGVFACLRPGRLLRGPLPGGPGGVAFPSWFGRNSTQGKNARLLSELSQHTRISTHGGAADPRSLLMDYLQPLAVKLTTPLKEGDINGVVECLDAYQLQREDMDNIMELTTWPGRPCLLKAIDSKVKAALTRSYNKTVHKVSYATDLVVGDGKKKKRRLAATVDTADGEEAEAEALLGEESGEEDEEENPEVILKLAKVAAKPKTSTKNGSAAKKPRKKKTDA